MNFSKMNLVKMGVFLIFGLLKINFAFAIADRSLKPNESRIASATGTNNDSGIVSNSGIANYSNLNKPSEKFASYETRIEDKKPSLKSRLQSSFVGTEELKNHGNEMGQALALIPSVSTYGMNAPGMVPSVFIQGAGSDHTQFYWNGFLLNDPSMGGGGFDLTLLQILFSSQILQSIQVYSGAQGVDFGNGAMGGVILLYSNDKFNSSNEVYQVHFRQNYFNDLYIKNAQGHAEIFSGAWRAENYTWNFVLANQRSEGPSAASPTDFDLSNSSVAISGSNSNSAANSIRGNKYISALNQFESDAEEKKMLLFDYQYRNQTEPVKLKTMALYSALDSSIDAAETVLGDDPNAKTNKNFFQFGLGVDYQLTSEQSISSTVSWVQTNRKDNNETDSGTDVSNHSANIRQNNSYEGQAQTLKLEHSYQNNILKNKLGYLKNTDQTRINENFGYGESLVFEKQNISSVYWKPEWKIRPEQTLATGVRHQCLDSNSGGALVDCQSVYELDWNYSFHESSGYYIRWGQAMKSPTLFQRHSTLYGKKDLTSEKVDNYSLGWNQAINYQESFQIRAFQNNFQDLIQFNSSTNKYASLGRAQSWGTDLQYKFHSLWWDWQLQWSYLQAKDQQTGLDLLRRPRHQINWILDWPPAIFQSEWAWFSEIHYRSESTDFGSVGSNNYQRVSLPESLFFSWGVSKKVNEYAQVKFRWNNFLSRWWSVLRPSRWDQSVSGTEAWGFSGQQEQVWLGIDCFLPEFKKKN